MFRDIKADPKIPHHYIIVVGIKNTTGNLDEAGDFYLKYEPFYFTHEDLINLRDGIALSEDPLYTRQYRMKKEECLQVTDSDKFLSLWAIVMGAKANNCSIHHFSSAFEISTEYFEDLLKVAKIDPETRRLLNAARTR